MIPQGLTHREVGYWLQAVGHQMAIHNLCFDAALDGDSHDEIMEDIVSRLLGDCHNDPLGRAEELLRLTGEEALNFNELEHL